MTESRMLIEQGLQILASGLEPVVARRIAELLPQSADWTVLLEEKDRQSGRGFSTYNRSDVFLLLRVITERLGSLGYPFSDIVSRDASNWASELRTVRNRWAHNEPFTAAEAYRGLETISLLLNSIGAASQGVEIDALKNRALLLLQGSAAPVETVASAAPDVPPIGEGIGVNPDALQVTPGLAKPTTDFSVEAVGVLSYALARNQVAIVDKITVDYRGDELRAASVTVEALSELGSLGDPKVLLLDLDGVGPSVLRDVSFMLDPARMLAVDTQLNGTLRVTLRDSDGAALAEHVQSVVVLAANQWIARPLQLGLELVASFVQPNAEAIADLVGEASTVLGQLTESSALDGYQSGNPERIDAMARALYEVMQARDIRYAEPPASWGMNGQKVRTPEEVLIGRLGTCLDTTVTFAAALEEMGVNSTLWFVSGHVFVGYWRSESSLDTPAEMDVSEAINYVGLGAIQLLETTSIPLGESFETATRRPNLEHLPGGSGNFIGITDIQQSRLAGIFPLPSRSIDASGSVSVKEYRVAAGAPILEVQPSETQTVSGPERDLPARVTQWKNALLDLSLRNRLINYTERAGHNLAVPSQRLAMFEDAVNEGKAITLIAADDIADIDRARGVRTGRDLPDEQLAQFLVERKRVYINISAETYATRLRNLAHKARTIAEETGANNLYLALGMLEWRLDGRELRSPLVLVPVTLTSTSRGSTYRITLDDAGESTPNYCLLEKLKVSFGLEIPGLANPARDEAGIDLAAAFRSVRHALADAKLPFTVSDTADLAILQFAKFRLWKDIDEQWEVLATNPLVHHLVYTPTQAFTDPVATSEQVDLDAVAAELPVPADASQTEAAVEANEGKTFVLEGPPGTGKSQTITNLLAHAIGQGKKVLFVAEKRAALDVVKQRLDAVGLGALSMDLHDKGARPNAFREQLVRAIDAGYKSDGALLASQREISQASTSVLRRYAERLHETNAFGFSLYSAQDRLLAASPEVPAMPVPIAFLRRADADQAEVLRTLLRRLPETADLASPEPLHPWGFVGSGLAEEQEEELYAAAREFDASLSDLLETGTDQAILESLRGSADAEMLANLAGAPRIPLEQLDAARSPFASGAIEDLRNRMEQAAGQLPAWSATVSPEALDLNASAIYEHALAADNSGFFGRKKRQRAVLSEFGPALQTDPRSVDPKSVSGIAAAILATSQQITQLAHDAAQVPTLPVGPGWSPYRGAGTAPVLAQIDWLRWLVPTLSPLTPDPSALTEILRRFYASTAADRNLADRLRRYAVAWQQLDALTSRASAGVTALKDWSRASGLISTWLETRRKRNLDIETPVTLQRWTAFLSALEPLRSAGMNDARQQLLTGELPADVATLAFDKGLAQSSLHERQESQALGAFDAAAHNKTVARFTESGAVIRNELPRAIPERAMQLRKVNPHYAGGAMGDLKRQLNRKRGGMSVRALFEHYESIILQLAPCLLMSPESVSRFLPVKQGMFDIVVFDEASQIRVADAIGAMGRGSSVVVVGDSKQMPPTSFAEAQLGDSSDVVESVEVVVDEESILTECVQARVPQRWLSWHYRSQDEALISFSNHTYYDNRLSSFPSPLTYAGSGDHGISLIRVDGTFNRSGKGNQLRTNQEEAEAIVADVARRFAESTDTTPSLGIVTFNAQQRSLIEALLREHADERLGEALDERNGLFVKNLENVQGDERDTILFSVAFSANDRGVVPLNFGPLTRAGGERRLNVAITRARRQVVLYSSFDPQDLQTERTVSVGIKHLKAYMELAVRGVEESVVGTAVQPMTDRHRDEIANELRLRGYAVRADLGLSEFRVDISVAKADAPDQALLAILLDGESWRSRRTVADRDGMPVEVLGNLMRWPAVERVWLPEWLQDREGTIDRLCAAMEAAAVQSRGTEAEASPGESEIPASAEEASSVDAPEVDASSLNRVGTVTEVSGSAGIKGADSAEVAAPVRVAESQSASDGNLLVASSSEAAAVRAFPHEQSVAPSHAAMQVGTVGLAHPQLLLHGEWEVARTQKTNVLDALPLAQAVQRVQEVIEDIVATEGPIQKQRLARFVGEAFELSRVSGTRADQIMDCVPRVMRKSETGTFVWPEGVEPGSYAIARRPLEGERRDLDTVPLEEIANAMAIVTELAGGMDRESIQREALALFGGKRITAGISARLDQALHLGSRTGRLVELDNLWMKG